jgi:6-phosphogluconolactonase
MEASMQVLKKAVCAFLVQCLFGAFYIMPAAAKTFVYISCADDGEIAAMEMNLETGDLTMIGKAKAGKVVMPMAVSPDRRYLYAAIRSVPRVFMSYAIDSTKGELTHLSTVPSPDNMVYIAMDKTGRFLLGASYTGDKISVNPIGERGFVQAEPVQVMNTGSHPHSILPDTSNRFVYVPVLGADQIMQLKFDEKRGTLTPNKPAVVKTIAGAGPKTIAFSPNNRFVYVQDQLDGMLRVYAFDNETGLLREIQSVSSVPRNANLPPGKVAAGIGATPQTPGATEADKPSIHASDIHITPDGKFLYTSEETTSTLAAFAVDSVTGALRYINNYATETQPRGFNIDPRGNLLLAAGQKSDHCMVHKINRNTGELLPLKRVWVGKNPNWIEIVDFP